MFSDPKGCCYSVILYGHKQGIHKKVTIIAVSRKAIFTLCIYIVTYTTKEGFSKLYFEEHEKLPKIINAGKEEKFAFTVASHELNMTSYEYVVSIVDHAENNWILRIPQKIELITFLKNKSKEIRLKEAVNNVHVRRAFD